LSLSIPGADLPLPPIRFDKLVHAVLFFVFAWLWLDTKRKTPPVLKVLIAVVILAVCTEVYQGFLPWERIPDPYDSLANLIGGLLGIFAYLKWQKKKSDVK